MRYRCFPAPPRVSRHTAAIPCQVVRERDFRLVADRIANLSLTGLLVGPADPVLTGERLIVSFQAPRWGTWIDVEATVARVVHGRRPGEFSRALGLRFEALDPWSRWVLERNLSGLPPVPPGRWRNAGVGNAAVARLARLSGSSAPTIRA